MNGVHVVGNEDYCTPLFRCHVLHLPKTFLLKLGVAYREHFVDEKNLWVEVSSNRESEPYIHASRIPLRRRVEELLYLGKGDDFIKLSSNFRPTHAEDRAVHKNVFAPS